MEILGRTVDDRIIIAVSEEEWGNIQKGTRVTVTGYSDTEAYKVLERAKLRLSWRGWLLSAFENGDFDGSVNQLVAFIESGKPVAYKADRFARLSEKSIQKIYRFLKDNNVPHPAP